MSDDPAVKAAGDALRQQTYPGTEERLPPTWCSVLGRVAVDAARPHIEAEARAEADRLRAENELLRKPHDAYTVDGEPFLPRGWVPVDGGRLDELESLAAEADRLRAALQQIYDLGPPPPGRHERLPWSQRVGVVGAMARDIAGAALAEGGDRP